MDINNQKWTEALNNSDSDLSVSSTNGNKLKIKNDHSMTLNKVLKGLWLSLTILTVTTGALTLNEWTSRMDTIKQGISNGSINTTTEAVDSQFYVNRGANFKDSFLAVVAKVKNQFEPEKELTQAERDQAMERFFNNFSRVEPKSLEITEAELIELEKKYPIQELNEQLKQKSSSENKGFTGKPLNIDEVSQKIKQKEAKNTSQVEHKNENKHKI